MAFLLKTDRSEYRNDIAEVVRLFLGQTEILFDEREDGAAPERILTAGVSTDNATNTVFAFASMDGMRHSESGVCSSPERLARKRVEKRTLKIAVFRLMREIYPCATPWGSLTGIRPTKLFRELTESSSEAEAEQKFLTCYDVSNEKTALAKRICTVQKPYIEDVGPKDIDIYINIPFCKTKCLYCSFPSEILVPGRDAVSPFLEVLKKDIEAGAALVQRNGYRLRCMYMGGGTPTVLSPEQLDAVLNMLEDGYGSLGCEMTVEAGRPDTITKEKLSVLKAHGIGRISINPQTMNNATLERIGRSHTAEEIVFAYRDARDVGFSVINMDLIAGLPGESLNDFSETLKRISDLNPENLTVHTLAIKHSSVLNSDPGKYPRTDAETVEKMVTLGGETAERLGMVPYYMYRQKYMSGNLENVGYAKTDAVCRYNIDMMEETTSILAHGASGMSKRIFSRENRVERIPNPKDIRTYKEKLEQIILQKEALFD